MPDGFQEEWRIRKKYIDRLTQLLFKKVDQGLLSRQQAINEILAVRAEVLNARTTGFPWAKTGRFQYTQQELGERGFLPFYKEISRYQSPAEWTAFLTVETRRAEKYQAGLARERQEIRGIETARKQREAKGKMQAGMAMMKGQEVWGQQRAMREYWDVMAKEQEARARAGEFVQRPSMETPEQREARLQQEWQRELPTTGGENWIRRWYMEHMPAFMPEAQEIWEAEEDPTIRAEMGWVGDLIPHEAGPTGAPKIPTWMRPLAPGMKITPTGVEGGRFATPSGQMWGRLLPSQKEQYAGLLEWGGTEPWDIMAKMGQMAPRTPLGRPRWRSIRQRISR